MGVDKFAKDAREVSFAKQLKKLCQDNEVYELDCYFTLAINNHSTTHPRHLVYKSKIADLDHESLELTIVEKKAI